MSCRQTIRKLTCAMMKNNILTFHETSGSNFTLFVFKFNPTFGSIDHQVPLILFVKYYILHKYI